MLETGTHQAAGLAALAAWTAHRLPRLGALVAHGDSASELPLLWQLCATWTELDYPVAVLDACARESDATPGLLQLLQGEELDEAGTLAQAGWPVLPAALGLSRLCRLPGSDEAAQRLRALLNPFGGYEMLVLYAPAALLTQLLPHSGLAPLLSVGAGAHSQLSAYQTLKRLLNPGGLRPTIVSVMDEDTETAQQTGAALARKLQYCAREFLACEVPALTVCGSRREPLQRLALRSLEEALPPPAEVTARADRADRVPAARSL